MEKSLEYGSYGRNGIKPFFSLYPIRPVGRIFCSPEQSKLCFEMLEINSAPQNHLPLQGVENRSEVAVYSNY
jgi:hypothetical protein